MGTPYNYKENTMPNWCMNEVEIKGNPEVLKKLVERINKDGLLNSIKPLPKELKDLPSPPESKEIEEKMMEKYGAKDWYDWSVKNWGTKWEIDNEGLTVNLEGENLHLVFNSAWSPPVVAMNTLLLADCVDELRLSYFEPGACFAGVYDNGINTTLEDVDEMSNETGLMAELEERFGISGWYEDCEEE